MIIPSLVDRDLLAKGNFLIQEMSRIYPERGNQIIKSLQKNGLKLYDDSFF